MDTQLFSLISDRLCQAVRKTVLELKAFSKRTILDLNKSLTFKRWGWVRSPRRRKNINKARLSRQWLMKIPTKRSWNPKNSCFWLTGVAPCTGETRLLSWPRKLWESFCTHCPWEANSIFAVLAATINFCLLRAENTTKKTWRLQWWILQLMKTKTWEAQKFINRLITS